MIPTRETLATVLEGVGDSELTARARTVLARHEEPPPWYVRLLSGAGGWFSATFLLSFIGLVGLFDGPLGQLVLGLIFCGVAIALHVRHVRRGGAFSGQLGLALSLAGQGLVIVGAADLMDFSSDAWSAICLHTAAAGGWSDLANSRRKPPLPIGRTPGARYACLQQPPGGGVI